MITEKGYYWHKSRDYTGLAKITNIGRETFKYHLTQSDEKGIADLDSARDRYCTYLFPLSDADKYPEYFI